MKPQPNHILKGKYDQNTKFEPCLAYETISYKILSDYLASRLGPYTRPIQGGRKQHNFANCNNHSFKFFPVILLQQSFF